MPVNQKPVYASEHLVHASRLPIKPGERIDERLPEHALRAALESGAATDDPKVAEAVADAETARQIEVDRQIMSRSEKRAQAREKD